MPRDISKHLQLLILTVCIDNGPGMAVSRKKRVGKGVDEENENGTRKKKGTKKRKEKEESAG